MKKINDFVANPKITWLVDLDNTLYMEESNLMPTIDQRIEYYLSYKCRCSLSEAQNIRQDLLTQYHNTFMGALEEKIVYSHELAEFINFTHSFVPINKIVPNKAVVDIVKNAKGKKYIFSNSTKFYISRILKKMGLVKNFDGVIDIQALKYTFKPKQEAFDLVINMLSLNPVNSVLIDDSVSNLKTAEKMNINTIHSLALQ